MSAQATDAVLPNGTGGSDVPVVQGSEKAVNSQDQLCAGGQVGEASQQTRDIPPREVECGELAREIQDDPSRVSVAATTAVQVKQQSMASTTLTVGGQQDSGNSGLLRPSAEQPTAPRTPTGSAGSRSIVQPSWLGNMEVPRWFAKLGNILNPGVGGPPVEWAPSPMPGASPFSSPPGGPTFRLRSPGRPRAIHPAPTPPSSSSIPAEAIQAEVQRQLGGVLQQLQDFGIQNERLQQELEDTRAQLRMEQQRNVVQDHTLLRSGGLLGDLATASLDPGHLADTPPIPPPADPRMLASGAAQGYVWDQVQGDSSAPQQRVEEPGIPGYERRQSDDRGPVGQRNNEAPGMLRSWWERQSRSTTPPPRAATAANPEVPVLEALARGVQQLQELQMQAMSKPMPVAHEQVKPGTMSLNPMPEIAEGTETALTFQDWLEVSSSVMSDISESSATWWQGVIGAVEQVYARWLTASPLEKLTIEPTATEQWCTGRWLRVNARASSMLLAAMPSDLKGDMVSRRCTQDCVRMLYRLYTHYQPGGSAERSEVLSRLQSPVDTTGSDNLEGVVKILRAWPRWLERCKAVQMTPPDPSVLSRGLQALTTRFVETSPDANFRTSMLRASLRLDARPTLEQVVGYHRHLKAELELLLGAKGAAAGAVVQPKLRAVDTALPPKARDAGGKSGGGTELCRYFAKATGCKRGDKCNFSHNMSSLDRDVRARKCLRCGSEAHRQKDCVVGKGAPKAKGGGGKDGSPTKPTATGTSPSTQSTMATLGTTSASQPATLEPVPGTPWTLESLVQAAQQMVQGQSQEGQGSDASPEKTRPAMRVLKLRDIRVCSMEASTTALLDSGATHSLRSAKSEEEWCSAEEVGVQLAGSHTLVMRITESGTLLMPYKSTADGQGEVRAQTIVPMGQLIKTLGYTMVWSPEECYLSDESGNKLPLQVSGGCPQLTELEALALIARLEDRKLEQLQNETLLTKDRLSLSAMAMEVPWNHYLYDYVTKGAYESGLRAVRDAPFFEDIPGGCLEGLVPIAGLWSGWDILKEVCFLSRAQRRRLLTSKRWVVHLFAGREGHWEIMKLDQGDTTVIELDLARNAGQDLFRTEVWRMLLWGAKEGKVDVIMGGPPGRAQQHLKGGVRDVKSLKLIARMMWLFAVAQVGREADRSAVNKNRDVGFILEYPEGRHPRSKEEREQRIQRAEEDSRGLRNRGEGASWDHSIQYWENVQKPRWIAMVGSNTVDASHSFWETRMWKAFEKEAELCTVSFDQGAMGSATRNRTSLGTNIHSLLSLENLRVDEDDPMPERGESDHIWSPGLVNAVVVAMNFWERSSRMMALLR
ncbi:hypothetical protein AK812_SmicGene37856 [Symbiodinium microadriaticum]|uniref:Retrovirus-related Pol polyprotein from transposon TNT 1-94 n=1 Tax=Symbiodinium microadriaticum TaxID=2951 RepID=A0A1Q9CFA3_SYMMI|nr:hypothetical protein AK812_SmicGene37856 [Symbiodinium microadriaticum]